MIDDEEDEKVNESEEMSRAEGNSNPLIMSTPKTVTSISTPNSKYSIKKSDTMSRASGYYLLLFENKDLNIIISIVIVNIRAEVI
jgi:hypothetical protein